MINLVDELRSYSLCLSKEMIANLKILFLLLHDSPRSVSYTMWSGYMNNNVN